MTPDAPILVASAAPIAPEDRLDLVVHAVAQLPERIGAEIYGEGGARANLELLTEAYGLGDRVRFHDAPSAPNGALVVYTSRHNAATAPLRAQNGASSMTVADGAGTMAELLEAIAPAGEPTEPPGDLDGLSGIRVVLVTNYPTHYRIALLNEIAARLSAAGASLRVLFSDADPAARGWMRAEPLRFEHEFMRALPIPVAATDLPLRLGRSLRAHDPSMVITGGFSPLTAPRLGRFCARRGIAYGIWSGEIAGVWSAQSRLRTLLRKRAIKRTSFGIAYGHEAGEYLRSLRPDLPVVYGRNTTVLPPPAERRDGGPVRILAVSRAIEAKGLDLLVDALGLLDGVECELVVAGGGDQLEALRQRAAGDSRIRFLGAVDSDRVGELYSEADIFAFPTRGDRFGLVMVEAFAAGLAVVTSTAVGANADLAVAGRNCLVVEQESPRAWADALRRLIDDARLRRSLGDAASATVRGRWTIDHAAGAVICGIRLGVLAGAPGRR